MIVAALIHHYALPERKTEHNRFHAQCVNNNNCIIFNFMDEKLSLHHIVKLTLLNYLDAQTSLLKNRIL